MKTRGRYTAGVALLLGATTACSDAPSAPPEPPALNVTSVIARAVTVAFGTYMPGADAAALPAACEYSASAGAFVCTPAALGQLTYTLTYSLLDADGRPLAEPSASAATMRAVIELRGRRTGPAADDGSATTAVAGHYEMLASGLRTGTLTLSGDVASHYDFGASGGGVPHSVSDAVGAIRGVLFDDGARWPRAGTITGSEVTSVVKPGEGQPTTSRSASSVAFDGTSVVTIVTSVGDSTLHCRFDLDGRVATTCS
jgi:hypothetical protein